MTGIYLFIGGGVFGAAVVLIIQLVNKKEARAIARELVSETESEKLKDIEGILGRVKDSMGSMSLAALKTNSEEFMKLAGSMLGQQTQSGEKDLEGKKKLIDQTLESMRGDLQKMQDVVSGFEKERVQKYGELSAHLKTAAEQTAKLQDTANHLRQALVSTKARGLWGERMAEDVLQLAGFVEGVNYVRQRALEGSGSRPDYTFQLPQGRTVNMDVKFPLNSYLRYLETENDMEREVQKGQFLRDVRSRIKEVTTRDYINVEEETLDYVLVFIPNEQVYAFINQNDPLIIDEALRNKVILCSPFTLFAILAVIRQAIDNFSTAKAANDMLRLIGGFNKEWEKFRESMDKMGRKIDDARDEYQKLATTRRNKLERPLQKIEDLRRLKGIEPELAIGEAEVQALDEAEEQREAK
ncbi:MAG: DNA recombination protein RmuC [Candidatus Aminicenantes bacterium]|jgi:DNA recombination protein RmuC|nr:MAG: DNA recombination protein RmuC [Candidatus Aminicenantes bacterium]